MCLNVLKILCLTCISYCCCCCCCYYSLTNSSIVTSMLTVLSFMTPFRDTITFLPSLHISSSCLLFYASMFTQDRTKTFNLVSHPFILSSHYSGHTILLAYLSNEDEPLHFHSSQTSSPYLGYHSLSPSIFNTHYHTHPPPVVGTLIY